MENKWPTTEELEEDVKQARINLDEALERWRFFATEINNSYCFGTYPNWISMEYNASKAVEEAKKKNSYCTLLPIGILTAREDIIKYLIDNNLIKNNGE